MNIDTVGLYDLGDKYKNGETVWCSDWQFDLIQKRSKEEAAQHMADVLIRLDEASRIIYYPLSTTEDFFEPGIYRKIFFEDVEEVIGRLREVKPMVFDMNVKLLTSNTLFDQINTLEEGTYEEYKVPEDCNGFIVTTIVSEFGYGWSCSITGIRNTPWFTKERKAPLFSAAGTGLHALGHIKEYFLSYVDGCTSGPYNTMYLKEVNS